MYFHDYNIFNRLKSQRSMPGKDNYDELIEVSYTVVFPKTDISSICYKTVCNDIIEQYFDQGIACTERYVIYI
jgi:hypothetical protein